MTRSPLRNEWALLCTVIMITLLALPAGAQMAPGEDEPPAAVKPCLVNLMQSPAWAKMTPDAQKTAYMQCYHAKGIAPPGTPSAQQVAGFKSCIAEKGGHMPPSGPDGDKQLSAADFEIVRACANSTDMNTSGQPDISKLPKLTAEQIGIFQSCMTNLGAQPQANADGLVAMTGGDGKMIQSCMQKAVNAATEQQTLEGQ